MMLSALTSCIRIFQFFPIALFLIEIPASGAIAPKDEAALQRESSLVLDGTVKKLRIETESSRFEGAGNWDWGIYLTLGIDRIVKGEYAGSSIQVRCFRIKSRASIVEFLTPQGNETIPGVGSRVRVYLSDGSGRWDVLIPNGIGLPASNPASGLEDAPEVMSLRSIPYTYLLPLEAWGLVLFLGLSCSLVRYWMRRRQIRRRQYASASGTPD